MNRRYNSTYRAYGKRPCHEEKEAEKDESEQNGPRRLNVGGVIIGKVQRHRATYRHRRSEENKLGPFVFFLFFCFFVCFFL